ncbi:cell wall metabolism sensor histidine kinase WalK [Microbispora sp. H10836]|uniref:sensor histidine kinase n=1 Tax=Microbispora sp. H10836 TaxID=2729106 RepID=UPI00147442C1|nr:HAMP domain-containing sensor histidine kinase [Microbispora sp. H10836]
MRLHDRFSITRRITLFTGATAVLLCALLAMSVMMGFHRYVSDTVTREVAVAGGRVAVELERGQLTYPLVEYKSRDLQVLDPSGRVVASTTKMQGKPRMARFVPPDTRNSTTCVVCGGDFPAAECNIVVAQWAHRMGERWMVYSASPVVPPWVDTWLAGLVGASAAALAAAITYVGFRNVRASLRPVNAIRAELDEINGNCPGRRVPVPPTNDEIRAMADSVNRTLSRLDGALQQVQSALRHQRQFVSNASHDLRTPIAAMRAEVEDGLLAPEETSVPELGSVLLPSLDRLQAIVHDLLTLDRLDHGVCGEQCRLDLAELVSAELRNRRHPAKRVECALEPGVVVVGDRVGLARLLTNLLDNAERHAKTTITVSVRHEPGEDHGAAVLEVVDDGPGIDRDKRELVFDRFIRLDAARSRDAGGAGLGLAIARQIAETHGGSLGIEDSPVGARFVLRLTAVPATAAGPADDSLPTNPLTE